MHLPQQTSSPNQPTGEGAGLARDQLFCGSGLRPRLVTRPSAPEPPPTKPNNHNPLQVWERASLAKPLNFRKPETGNPKPRPLCEGLPAPISSVHRRRMHLPRKPQPENLLPGCRQLAIGSEYHVQPLRMIGQELLLDLFEQCSGHQAIAVLA